jgi:hypothetical protein
MAPEAEETVSLIHLFILGALSVVAGTCLILASWLGSRSGQSAAVRPAQHRAVDGAHLAPSPVEVIRPFGYEQGRTDEMPRVEAPVAHVEAAEEQPEEGAIGTMAADESPEMADAAWRHAHDQRWTALLVGWAQRPDWLADFGADSLQLPEYRRLVLEHTGEISAAALFGEKVGAR